MAASATPRNADRPCVAVAASGGRDSTALLHAAVRQARALGLRVAALHVHHGLQPQADDWVHHLKRQCRRWAATGAPLTLRVHRVAESPAPGESIEAWARVQRYRALAAMAQAEGASLVLLAHHRRDQAETVLLQALRGAGARGLAAMPSAVTRDGLTWARPWLGHPREAIDAYVRRHRLTHVADPTNTDARPARSRLRTQVMPALRQAFVDADTALSQVARTAAMESACLADLAGSDLAALGAGAVLPVVPWAAAPPHRRWLMLREWLRRAAGRGLPDSLLQRLAGELLAARGGRWPAVGGELRLYRGQLSWCPTQGQRAPAGRTLAGAPAGAVPPGPGSGEPVCVLPAPGGRFEFWPADAHGLPRHRVASARAVARAGGEQFMARAGAPARSLKKQYQDAGVPAWERTAPLLFCDDDLVFVPGLGLDARALAGADEPQVAVRWVAVPAA